MIQILVTLFIATTLAITREIRTHLDTILTANTPPVHMRQILHLTMITMQTLVVVTIHYTTQLATTLHTTT
jgi:hypothetical protein